MYESDGDGKHRFVPISTADQETLRRQGATPLSAHEQRAVDQVLNDHPRWRHDDTWSTAVSVHTELAVDGPAPSVASIAAYLGG